MKMCKTHWEMMRASISNHGLEGLVAKSGEEAAQNMKTEIEGGKAPFDPLMSMNWHFSNGALACGGLAMMELDENGNHHCPLCEFEKNAPGFVPQTEVDLVAGQIREWCIGEGLIPKPS